MRYLLCAKRWNLAFCLVLVTSDVVLSAVLQREINLSHWSEDRTRFSSVSEVLMSRMIRTFVLLASLIRSLRRAPLALRAILLLLVDLTGSETRKPMGMSLWLRHLMRKVRRLLYRANFSRLCRRTESGSLLCRSMFSF